MKILYLTPAIYNSAGTERVLSMKVNYFIRSLGYEIVIVTTDQKGRATFYEFDSRTRMYDLGLNYQDDFSRNIIVKAFEHFRKNSIYRKKLSAILLRENPDICISLGGKEIEFLYKLPCRCKKIMELHFSRNIYLHALSSRHDNDFWKLIGRIQTWLFVKRTKRLDGLVVLTKKDLKIWRMTNNNVWQIYNPLPYQSKITSCLSSKTMIAVGRLSAQKNFPDLIEVWKYVHQEYPDWKLNIWGDGEDKDLLIDLIKSNKLEDVVLLRGLSNQIGNEYLKSSAYLMTSKYEGFPMVLLEAASFGLPLISYDCECGPSDIIRDGHNGFLVPEGNVVKMAEAICRLIRDVDLRKQMGCHSKLVSSSFSQENVLPMWPRFFQDLIGG